MAQYYYSDQQIRTEDIVDGAVTMAKIADGEKYIFLPATSFVLDGASWETRGTTRLLKFPDGSDTYAYIVYKKPHDFQSGSTTNIKLLYTSDVTSGDMRIELKSDHFNSNDVISDTYRYGILTTKSAPDTAYKLVVSEIPDDSINWLRGDYEYYSLRIGRLGTDSSDTATGSLLIYGIIIYYIGKVV